jgi:hypothetical protein
VFSHSFWPVPVQKLFSETYESYLDIRQDSLGWGISPTQGFYLHTQHNTGKCGHIHASSGIRIHDPSVRAAEDCTCLAAIGTGKYTLLMNEILQLFLFSACEGCVYSM